MNSPKYLARQIQLRPGSKNNDQLNENVKAAVEIHASPNFEVFNGKISDLFEWQRANNIKFQNKTVSFSLPKDSSQT